MVQSEFGRRPIVVLRIFGMLGASRISERTARATLRIFHMEIEFISESPRERARPRLDTILSRAEDQLAVACAFCTGAGVQLLHSHVGRFKTPDSFLVVSAALPIGLRCARITASSDAR